jgi:transposase
VIAKGVANLIRGVEVNEITRLHRDGVSTSEIGRILELDRKTVRKYLADPRPRRYERRAKRGSKLEPFVEYIRGRLEEGVWNAVVLLGELRGRGYEGGYTVLTDFLHPLREQGKVMATRRFETGPGRQAQVDWARIGTYDTASGQRPLYCFVLTLCRSRAFYAEVTTDTSLSTFVAMHERAFSYLGGVPEEVLYDNDGMIVVPSGWKDGDPTIQPGLVAFAEHHRYRIRLCRPRRSQTKGKIERGVRYVRQNFLCGRKAESIEDLNAQLLCWLATVANVRVHGETHRLVSEAWEEEKPKLGPFAPMPIRLLPRQAVRRVPRDCFVSYKTNRYSVPWRLAGQEVFVVERAGVLEIYRDESLVARHEIASSRYQRILTTIHHQDMPYGAAPSARKATIHIPASEPAVEQRDLSIYEEAAA